MNIGFVFINFNNSQYTHHVVDSIARSDGKHAPIVIVDNSSKSKDIESLSRIQDIYKSVHIIFNDKNVGYFPGLNIGIKYIRESFIDLKYIVVGNNDLLFPCDFVQSIERCHEDLSKYPVVSPDITMLNGTHQNPHVISGISRFREFIYDLYHLNYSLAGLIVKLSKLTHGFTDREDEQHHDIAQEIYQGYGACYILGPKFFEYFQELSAPTFLMYEEFFLAKQLEEKGFKTYYQPLIKVQHHCHASTSQLPSKKRWEFSKDAHKEYRKHIKYWR